MYNKCFLEWCSRSAVRFRGQFQHLALDLHSFAGLRSLVGAWNVRCGEGARDQQPLLGPGPGAQGGAPALRCHGVWQLGLGLETKLLEKLVLLSFTMF